MATQPFLSAEAGAPASTCTSLAVPVSSSLRAVHHAFSSTTWETSSERWRHVKVGSCCNKARALSLPFHQTSSSAVLANEFCGQRSTRQVSKLHFGRPRVHPGKHGPNAESAVCALLSASSPTSIPDILDVWTSKLYPKEDYTYILRELGNNEEGVKALATYEWAIKQDFLQSEKSKLLSTIISTLGRLGKVELAQQTFDKAVAAGFGRTVHAYSALVSAYGRSGQCNMAFKVFEGMKKCGCRPNLVTYNAMLDACSKGGANYNTALQVLEEMKKYNIEPDRITFNCLLAVCSRGSLWDEAKKALKDMQSSGIVPDLVTYNTLLDAICKSGKMQEAAELLSNMRNNAVMPNVVTYSTLLDGYAKAGCFSEAVAVHKEMRKVHIDPDRVAYNSLVDLYAKLGKLTDALAVCTQMEMAGHKKDAITYNALLDAFCKQGKHQDALKLLEKMKGEGVEPNLLTYSPLIDAFLKAGLCQEALQMIKEFNEAGIKPDVVLYTSLIDALCKGGLVKDATNLLNQMIDDGIRPNVVTFNSLIDAYGRKKIVNSDGVYSVEAEHHATSALQMVRHTPETSDGNFNFSRLSLRDTFFKRSCSTKLRSEGVHQDILTAVGLFQKMWELGVKPNVVTFSAILHACGRCASFTEAASLLDELCKFDSKVYGVAYGLLMGMTNQLWQIARLLFDEVACMDQPTAEAFYNALADILWHFGQRLGAQRVVVEARRRHIWVLAWQMSQQQYCLDLHSMSVGAAQAMLHAWLLDMRSTVFEGYQLPKLVSILTGWGRHSKVPGSSIVKQVVESRLLSIGAPFHVAKSNEGRLVSTGPVVGGWLREDSTLERIVLHDARVNAEERRGWTESVGAFQVDAQWSLPGSQCHVFWGGEMARGWGDGLLKSGSTVFVACTLRRGGGHTWCFDYTTASRCLCGIECCHGREWGDRLRKVKKLIKALEVACGNGTSMISLIMPPCDQVAQVAKMLGDEFPPLPTSRIA
ncbi:hypothetical protein GOP47_0022788 [Adiantum capillus-veneris]|uniref:Smr domain-containing protein n=1 Tax=Adiantum capillus-veneris TaxID=13818 RepID=A0A9D4U803_ADICA|nr:hypothetical protein GOP47_0022788 [Adiantum capillus-veneris]